MALPFALIERIDAGGIRDMLTVDLLGVSAVSVPTGSGEYYVMSKSIFLVALVWIVIAAALLCYRYGTYFLVKRKMKAESFEISALFPEKNFINVPKNKRESRPGKAGFARRGRSVNGILFHRRKIKIYALYQYGEMCEYYCDADCMAGKSMEEKKSYFNGLPKSCKIYVKNKKVKKQVKKYGFNGKIIVKK